MLYLTIVCLFAFRQIGESIVASASACPSPSTSAAAVAASSSQRSQSRNAILVSHRQVWLFIF